MSEKLHANTFWMGRGGTITHTISGIDVAMWDILAHCTGLAADLHLASASQDTDMVEYLTGSPFIDELVDKKWQLDENGMLAIPNGPGLGVSLNLDAVEKHTGQRLGGP